LHNNFLVLCDQMHCTQLYRVGFVIDLERYRDECLIRLFYVI
jgi:hypothetical protein